MIEVINFIYSPIWSEEQRQYHLKNFIESTEKDGVKIVSSEPIEEVIVKIVGHRFGIEK